MTPASLLRFLQRRAVCLLPWFFCPPAVSLELPLEWQVFQRRDDEATEVSVRGKVPPGVTLVEAKADLPPGSRGQAVDWRVIASDTQIQDGNFSGSIPLQAGGWYRITVRFRASAADPVSLAESTVEHVGVGDIFVTAGQSNSSNHGQEKQTPRSGLVSAFNGQRWQVANDPQPGAGQFYAALWRCHGGTVQGAGWHHRLRNRSHKRARVDAQGHEVS